MADKKITALTELAASAKNHSADLLHIIDYSASPVNKKITLASLFSTIDTPITSFGAHTHDIGPTTAISAVSVITPNVIPAAAAETAVVINEDSNAFVDFRVESNNSAQAIFVDASDVTASGNANIVYINGDKANVDLCVKGIGFDVNNPTLYTDATYDSLGIGTNVLSGSYRAELHGDGVVVDSTCDTATSTALTMDSTTVIAATDKVFGPGIAPGTVVSSITNATTAVLSIATLATASNVTLTFIAAAGTGHALKSSGSVALQGYEELRTSQGAKTLSNAVPVHKLISDSTATDVALTLSDTGAVDGQLKHIYVTARPNTTGTHLIHQTNRVPTVALSLDNVGESISLIYDATNSNWIELSIAGLSGS
ncbi:MAG: hypothetical protein ABGY11_03840 [Candidatus Thioglobus sp.]|jgi:hypothetical protein